MKKWIAIVICTVLAACSSPTEKIPKAENESAQKVKESIEKYPNGTVEMRGKEKGKKRIGKWESFYPNGYKWSEINYVDGYREGEVVVYYPNGIMRYEGNYFNDERSGIWMFYDTTGVTVKKIDMELPHGKLDSLLNAG